MIWLALNIYLALTNQMLYVDEFRLICQILQNILWHRNLQAPVYRGSAYMSLKVYICRAIRAPTTL